MICLNSCRKCLYIVAVVSISECSCEVTDLIDSGCIAISNSCNIICRSNRDVVIISLFLFIYELFKEVLVCNVCIYCFNNCIDVLISPINIFKQNCNTNCVDVHSKLFRIILIISCIEYIILCCCIVVDGIITSAVKESIEIECRTSQNPCRFGFIRCKHIISSYINKAHNKLLTYSKSIVMK